MESYGEWTGLEKFTSMLPIFRARNFNFLIARSSGHAKERNGQNQSQCTCQSQSHFVLCYLNSTWSFHFCYNSMKSFCNEAFTVV